MDDDGPAAVSELADIAGFSPDVAYPAIHRLRGRGYLHEERRQYSLTEEGEELVARLRADPVRAQVGGGFRGSARVIVCDDCGPAIGQGVSGSRV